MSAITRFVGGLFNPRAGQSSAPSATPPSPNIGDAAGEAAARALRAKRSRLQGYEDTILAPTLGGVGKTSPGGITTKKTMLG